LRLAALFTGGKDSTYAIYRAVNMGHRVDILLTVFPAAAESYMFHYPNLHVTRLQSESMGIPQLTTSTEGVGEEELRGLRALVSQVAGKVDGVLTGAIASTYQKTRIERIAGEMGLVTLSPLWGLDQWRLLDDMLAEGFEVIITSVSAYGLDERWLGRYLDSGAIEELRQISARYGVSAVGEGGEMETLVLNCPLFRKRIEILRARKVWHGDSGYLLIEDAGLS
jgi:diphthine-ammonia ligase